MLYRSPSSAPEMLPPNHEEAEPLFMDAGLKSSYTFYEVRRCNKASIAFASGKPVQGNVAESNWRRFGTTNRSIHERQSCAWRKAGQQSINYNEARYLFPAWHACFGNDTGCDRHLQSLVSHRAMQSCHDSFTMRSTDRNAVRMIQLYPRHCNAATIVCISSQQRKLARV